MSVFRMKGSAGLLFSLIVAAGCYGVAAQMKGCENATVADIVFLVDGSTSISPENFLQVKTFLHNVIQPLDIGPNKVQIGVAQYSNDPQTEFLLKAHPNRKSLLGAVDKIIQKGGGTETGKAIDFMRTEFFTLAAGSRFLQLVPQIAVVITDGESTDDVIKPAQELRDQGVVVFAIGVGEAREEQLQDIANLDDYVFNVMDFTALEAIRGRLLESVCKSVEALADRFADIFFLVDSSIAQGPYSMFRSELLKFIKQMNVGPSAFRIGLAQYVEETKVEFFLNASYTKQATSSAVQRFRPRPPPGRQHNLAGALEYARTHFFTKEAGGRAHQGSRQFLVVVPGGDSVGPVDREAYSIHAEGVHLVAMSAGAGRSLMDDLASYSTYVFDSPKVSLLKQFLVTPPKKNVTEDCKGANVADVVFIVDESGSITTPNFQLVRTFLHSIISGLDVSRKSVRVGIVTYHEHPTAHIYLDTTKSKVDILQSVSVLPYRGGGTKTGAALNFTRDKVFTEIRGKRKNVQQVAVLITDGESNDTVSEAANSLRRAGVTIYAVGIRGASRSELGKVASYPSDKYIYHVDHFTDLKPLKQSLQKALCSDIIAVTTGTSTKTDIKQACKQKDDADIFFLMDDSGSIQNEDFEDMQKFIIGIIESFQIGESHVRIGLMKYSDSETVIFDPTTYSDAASMVTAVQNIHHAGGGTNTGRALEAMGRVIREAKESRGYKVPEYLIVITDGESQDKVKVPAENIRAQGVTIFAVGVKGENEDGANQNELEEIAGVHENTFLITNFDALTSLKDDIVRDICSPDACKDVPIDIIFLVDSSGSISDQGYEKMKDFMKSIITKSAIGENQVHIGVMQYSTQRKMEFDLTDIYSKDSMLEAIDNMKHMKQGTLTGAAITEVSQHFLEVSGGRPNVGQRLVIITDGKSQDAVGVPAEALRNKNVVIYAIGVDQADTTQLRELSGSLDNVFYVARFDSLEKLESQLVLKLCDEECKKTDKADILFLVDGSSSINETEFRSMKTFMQSMVNKTTVGLDHSRFGIVVYSDEPTTDFVLKNSNSKQTVLNAITNMKQPTGNTYTSKAMTFCLPYFGAEYGGRKALKVPQILMVITDGDATDQRGLKPASDELRTNKITVFSIGIGDAVKEQLETMAGGDKSKVFYVDNFDGLINLHKEISPELCNSTKPVCEKDLADVVFLLDRSGSIEDNNYKAMLNFTRDIVNSLDVRKEFIHVGLAQFSDEPHDEFFLTDFTNKTDMIAHIEKMEYTGGNTYLGKALRHIKGYFHASKGSRWSVPKNLVLVSDGNSHDDVEDAADDLRDLGIEVFAVGVGDVYDLQLLQITGTPERLFNVRNFDGLVKIKQKVIDALCKPQKIESKGCTIDVAMGFDITQRTGAPGQKLISGHTKLQTFLPQIALYLSSAHSLCCVAQKDVETRISYHLIGGDGQSLYDTNFEVYSEDVVKKVMSHPVSQPTYLNSAQLRAFNELFQAKSTANVKVLVIFSDGVDDVMNLQEESERLRQSGVSALLIVALEGVRDTARLQMLEFGRGFTYQRPLTISMPNVASTIFNQINMVSDRDCCNVSCKCSGHEGPRGSPGGPGSKGPGGQKGQQGFPGDEGVSGDRGPPGPSGPQGLQGCPGVSGQKGSRGVSGNRGENGEDGLDGINGEQGVTGVDGEKGERGHPGIPGIPGISGEPGLKGERGLRGDPGESGADNNRPGPKGEPGNPGQPGRPGADGKAGGDGVIGNPGADGRRGQPGAKGAPGGKGTKGDPGSPGPAGPQGRRGPNGEPGPKGISGFPGPQGAHGEPGPPGTGGRRGANGQKGQPGDPGVKGAPGSEGPRGAPGLDGRDGHGPPGRKGAKGDPGFPGYPGGSGDPGDKGTKGYPGRDGNDGRDGNSGRPGAPGTPGDPGYRGHRGLKGPPGTRGYTDCQLVTFIKNNCACSAGMSACPAFPTELVFGLDMSEDVTPAAFERQRSALLSLLDDITVSESNCPTGARVAVVAYNTNVRYLIRFQDYHSKKQLMESVKNIALESSSNGRQLAAAMRFVGQNVFKRVRAGMMMRKVAVFFSGGPTQDANDLVTSVMEYRALNIFPAIISLRNTPAIAQAMEVDDTRHYVLTVLRRDMAADLRSVKNCAICYDPCTHPDRCTFSHELQPQQVDVDLAVVLDGSREVQADEFAGAQQLLGSVVEQLVVSQQPRQASNQARVAVVQQSGAQTPQLEFGFATYQNRDSMRSHLVQKMQQRGGSSALGHTLQYTLREVLRGPARRKKVLLAVVGTETSSADRALLQRVSQKAQCEGVALFVVTVGDRYSRTQAEQLASAPVQQHLIHVDRLKADEQGYVQRFFRVFLNAVHKGVNTYPPPSLRQTCSQRRGNSDLISLGQGSAEPEQWMADEPPLMMKEEEEEEEEEVGTRDLSQSPVTYINVSNIPELPKLMHLAAKDVCWLPREPGSCSSFSIMWFFSSEHRRCLPFRYGGCGGNANRFASQRECVNRCGGGRGGGGGRGRRGGGGVEGVVAQRRHKKRSGD